MSAGELPRNAFAALTKRELEALSLLAAGHTAKTIATRLGSSEYAINERLREARRKTGIGSSRELARLLDAQKIWDKKIDLPPPSSGTHRSEPLAQSERRRMEGTIIMFIAVPVVAVGMMVAAGSSPHVAPAPQTATASKQMPLAGSWSLDGSRIKGETPPQRVTISFRVAQDRKWKTRVEIVSPDGTSTYAESLAAPDGVPVPITGNMDFIDTTALRQPAPNTLVMTLGKNGIPVSTRVYTVSKNLKSMTETIVWAGDHLPKLETTYFNRID